MPISFCWHSWPIHLWQVKDTSSLLSRNRPCFQFPKACLQRDDSAEAPRQLWDCRASPPLSPSEPSQQPNSSRGALCVMWSKDNAFCFPGRASCFVMRTTGRLWTSVYAWVTLKNKPLSHRVLLGLNKGDLYVPAPAESFDLNWPLNLCKYVSKVTHASSSAHSNTKTTCNKQKTTLKTNTSIKTDCPSPNFWKP